MFFQLRKTHRFVQVPSCCFSWAVRWWWGKVLKIGSKVRVLKSFDAFRMETSSAKALAVFPQKLPENLEGTVVFLHSILTSNRWGKIDLGSRQATSSRRGFLRVVWEGGSPPESAQRFNDFRINISGQIIVTSHDLTSKGSVLEGKSSYFREI